MKECSNCSGHVPIVDEARVLCQLCSNHFNREYQTAENIKPMLPEDPKERKLIPLWSGLFRYFPKSLVLTAKQSMIGHLQHYDKDEPMHWDRSKSSDDWDALMRHMVNLQEAIETRDIQAIKEHSGALNWRAHAVEEKALEVES